MVATPKYLPLKCANLNPYFFLNKSKLKKRSAVK